MGQVLQGLLRHRLVAGIFGLTLGAAPGAAGCTSPGSASGASGASQARGGASGSLPPLLAELTLPPVADRDHEPDGEDDGSAAVPAGPRLTALASAPRARFSAIAAPPGAHPLVCDLTPFAGDLYATFAVAPIALDGARIYRFHPAGGAAAGGAFTLAFDWDRGGVARKTHEVGGQGITRVRVIADRLMATDSDPPLYGGFGLGDAPFEGYLFVSDATGTFAPLGPQASPPAGTRILPLSFHVFDVIVYRGALVATGGTVSRIERGTRYPGGLHVGDLDSELLLPLYRPGEGWPVGVLRTTYMHRFAGRLYIGFQNNSRAARWDLAVLTGDPRDQTTPAPVLARITPDGGWLTQRFASSEGTLYWIGSGYGRDGRGSALLASSDGLRFTRVRLPDDAGAPQDMVVLGTTRYLLARGGLYRAGPDLAFSRVAPAPPGDPFGRWDLFCSAPLVAFDDALYAGSTRDGTLYRITPE